MLIVRSVAVMAALAGAVACTGCNSVYHKGARELAPEPERFTVRVGEAAEAGRVTLKTMDATGADTAGAAWEFERRVLSARDVFERLENPSVQAQSLMSAFDAAVRAVNAGTPDARTSVRGAVLLAERYVKDRKSGK